MTVDIGTNFDWSESLYKENPDVTIDGALWVNEIQQQHGKAIKDQASAVDNLIIPTQNYGNPYDVDMLSERIEKHCRRCFRYSDEVP